MKEPKKPSVALLWLLLIPLQLAVDVALVSLGAYLDTSMVDPEAMGHPAPVLMMFFAMIAGLFTIIVPIAAIIITIVRYHSYKKAYRKYMETDAMG